jgi:hypothetical protein
VRETNLAWALAEAAKPQMSALERNYVFVAIGAGDNFAAIRQLLKIVAAKHIMLRPDLLKRCAVWLDTYVGHREERYLRRLIGGQFRSAHDRRGSVGTFYAHIGGSRWTRPKVSA